MVSRVINLEFVTIQYTRIFRVDPIYLLGLRFDAMKSVATISVHFEGAKASTERELFEYSVTREIRVLCKFLIYDCVATSSRTEFDAYRNILFLKLKNSPDVLEKFLHRSVVYWLI